MWFLTLCMYVYIMQVQKIMDGKLDTSGQGQGFKVTDSLKKLLLHEEPRSVL